MAVLVHLVDGAVSSSNSGTVAANESEGTWKEAIVAKFQVLTRNLPGDRGESHS
jgi:hypothetical protein